MSRSSSYQELDESNTLKQWAEKYSSLMSKKSYFTESSNDPYESFARYAIPTKAQDISYERCYRDICWANKKENRFSSESSSSYKKIGFNAQRDFLYLLLAEIKMGNNLELDLENPDLKSKIIQNPAVTILPWLNDFCSKQLPKNQNPIISELQKIQQKIQHDLKQDQKTIPQSYHQLTYLLLIAEDFMPPPPKGFFERDPWKDTRNCIRSMRDDVLLRFPEVVLQNQSAINSLYLGTGQPKVPFAAAMTIVEKLQEHNVKAPK